MSDGIPPVPPTPPASGGLTERQWAVILHLSSLLVLLAPGVLNIVAPLIVWLLKRPQSPFLDAVGKRVLNFQISYSIYFFVLSAVTFALMFVLLGFLLIPVLWLLGIAWLVLVVVGAVKESNGETFGFPLSIPFLR